MSDWSRKLEPRFPGLPLGRLVRHPETLTDREVAVFRGICCESLHFVTTLVLGYDLLSGFADEEDVEAGRAVAVGDPLIHAQMCEQLHPPFERAQMHARYRGFFKSTIGTIARPIWMLMRDPAHYDFLLLVDDDQLGTARMKDIKARLALPRVLKLFPELAVDTQSPADKNWRIVGREADGYSGELRTTRQSQSGRHPYTVNGDDLVNDANYHSRDEQERLKKFITDMWPTLDHSEEAIFECTFYAQYDLWHFMLQEFHPEHMDIHITPVRGEATIDEDGRVTVEDTGVYADPRLWDDRRFEREKAKYKRYPYIFRCQYMLDTSYAEGESFSADWLRHRPCPDLRYFTRYIASDPATGEGSSHPAIAVVGYNAAGEVQVLHVTDEFTSEAAFIDGLFELYEVWRPYKVGVEVYAGHGRSMWQQIRRQCRERGIWMPLQEQRHGKSSKDEHIKESLRPGYEWKLIWHEPHLRGGTYEQQLLDFPGGEYKDLLDAVAYGVQLALEHGYRGPVGEEEPGEEDGVRMGPTVETLIRRKLLEPFEREDPPVKGGYW